MSDVAVTFFTRIGWQLSRVLLFGYTLKNRIPFIKPTFSSASFGTTIFPCFHALHSLLYILPSHSTFDWFASQQPMFPCPTLSPLHPSKPQYVWLVRVSAANSSETHCRLLLPASVWEDWGSGDARENCFSVQFCTVNVIMNFGFPQEASQGRSWPMVRVSYLK
jgi:hypothetical protein